MSFPDLFSWDSMDLCMISSLALSWVERHTGSQSLVSSILLEEDVFDLSRRGLLVRLVGFPPPLQIEIVNLQSDHK